MISETTRELLRQSDELREQAERGKRHDAMWSQAEEHADALWCVHETLVAKGFTHEEAFTLLVEAIRGGKR